jgi:mono/diheme cytochrome c family protein
MLGVCVAMVSWFSILLPKPSAADQPSAIDYSAVDSIFTTHCLDCHASTDPEGQLVLENFETLIKGGEIGPAILPGKSAESLLVQMIEGRFEKDGRKKIMPPGKRAKLTSREIATIKAWIDAGAQGPAIPAMPKELVVPKIEPKVPPRNPVNALAFSSRAKLLALGRYGEIELRKPDLGLVRTLPGHQGNVNGLVFSEDGAQLFAASGQPGVSGEIRQWNVGDGNLVRVLDGHKDALYAIALSLPAATIRKSSCGISRPAKKSERSRAITAACIAFRFGPTAKSWPAPAPIARLNYGTWLPANAVKRFRNRLKNCMPPLSVRMGNIWSRAGPTIGYGFGKSAKRQQKRPIRC